MNFKNILRNGILSGSLLLSACANTNDSLENKSKFYFSGGGNIGSENIDYDVEVGPLVQTTSVHKDDLHLGMHGATAADLSGEEEGKGNFKIGGHISYGTENVRLRIGGDVRFNEFADGGGDNFRSGLHDWRQQKSDHRPAWNAAFVFSQFTPGEVTYIPTAGLDFKFGGEQGGRDLVDYIGLTFGYSVGFPYSSFEVRSGHDRYSRWETVRIEEWDGFGLRHGPHIGIKIGNADFLASYFREN